MSRTPSTKRYHATWHRAARFVAQRLVLRPVVHSVTDVSVVGEDNLDALDGPYVVVSNHSSHLDAPLLVTTLPRRLTRDLAVGAATDYFYRQWWIKAATSLFFNSYPISRTRSDIIKGKDKGLANQLLSEDIPVLIFPEGTRRAGKGEVKRFKPGAAALCVTQDVPCLPVAILGADEAMPVGRIWPKLGRPPITLVIGTPMWPLPDEKTRDFNDRVEAKIAAMLATGSPDAEGSARPADQDVSTDDHPRKEAS